MADELDLELELDDDKENRIEKRFKNLEAKLKMSDSEKAELQEKLAKAEQERLAVEKEKNFLSSFSDVLAKYPNAHEVRDKIKEKVLSGYDAEDATIAILAKEGKFTPQVQTQPQEQMPVAGGSASNQIKTGEAKPVSEMTQAERWQAITEAATRGDISLT